jgi:hypothetical protein
MIMIRPINCRVLVKYFEEFDYFRSGYRNLRIHAAKVKPNNHTVETPPLEIALMPHLQIPQFKAKKNT